MNDFHMKPSVRHPSPPLSLLAIVHAALFAAGLVAFTALSGGGHIPSPFAAGSTSVLTQHADAVRWNAFFLLGSAVPLGLFAAVVASRLQFFGLRAAGVQIAFFGGILASLALVASGLSAWIVSDPGAAGSARALQLSSFLAGGPAFAAGFGLLAAGVSVTAGLGRMIPRWAMWLGLFVAAAGELSTLSLVLPPAMLLIPLTRFPGLVWLIAVAFMIPAVRKQE